MVLLMGRIGKPGQVVGPLVLSRHPAQKSSILNVRLVAIGLGPTNAEAEYRFPFSAANPQVLEARAQEGHGYPSNGCSVENLCEYQSGRDHVMQVQSGHNRGHQRYPAAAGLGTAVPAMCM
jgi:hypothetical protein